MNPEPRRAAISTMAAWPERKPTMTTPDDHTDIEPPSGEQLDKILTLLGRDQAPADNELLIQVARILVTRSDHQAKHEPHASAGCGYCANLTAWLGERAELLLRRVLHDHTDLTPLVVHWSKIVMPPEGEDENTIVCCADDNGRPVALVLTDEERPNLIADLQDIAPDGTHAPRVRRTLWLQRAQHRLQRRGGRR